MINDAAICSTVNGDIIFIILSCVKKILRLGLVDEWSNISDIRVVLFLVVRRWRASATVAAGGAAPGPLLQRAAHGAQLAPSLLLHGPPAEAAASLHSVAKQGKPFINDVILNFRRVLPH